MAELLEFGANQPAIAKALFVEVYAAGERALAQNELGAALLEHVIFLVPHVFERFLGEMRHGMGAHIVGGKV